MLGNVRVVNSSLKREVPDMWITDTVECIPGVRTASMVVSSREGVDLPKRLVIATKGTVQLPEGAKLGALKEVLMIADNQSDKQEIPESSKPATAEEHIGSMLSEVHSEVMRNQKVQLESLWSRLSDILSVNESDMGWTDLTQSKHYGR